MKKHNFSAGPSILPEFTIEETLKAIKDFAGTGISLMSVSHRGKEFEKVMADVQQMFKDLLDIPAGYSVLFLGGGASLQFAMVPMNLLGRKAFYLNTGVWATKALKEAKLFGEVAEISSKDKNFNYIPKGYTIPTDADYMHITTNNTIYGTEIRTDLTSPIPLVADMSSDIMSRPVDISKYALIYGGAQKNLAPAGVTFVIVKDEILGKIDRQLPTMLNYQTHIKEGSMFNTPPCVPIYACLQTLIWLKDNGGLVAMEKKNIEKANILYDEIERNKMFVATAEAADRSIMNICFVMSENYKELETEFLDFVKTKGMVGLKGHRLVGGFRASTYNALPKESVVALVDAMKEFEAKH